MILDTLRLQLRPLTVEDAVPLFECFGDSETMKYWLNGFDESLAATQRRVDTMIQHWRDHGFGDWAVIEKNSRETIGICGLHYIDEMTETNLGYVIRQRSQGRGYATEAARAALVYGFKTLKFPRIVAVIDPINTRSIRVAESCGMHLWRKITWMEQARLVYSALECL